MDERLALLIWRRSGSYPDDDDIAWVRGLCQHLAMSDLDKLEVCRNMEFGDDLYTALSWVLLRERVWVKRQIFLYSYNGDW